MLLETVKYWNQSQLGCSKRGDYGCCRGCLRERWTEGKTNALETGAAFRGFLSGEIAEAVILGFCVVALRVVEGCCGRIGEVSGILLPPETSSGKESAYPECPCRTFRA
jgi:hypothetical protein